MTYQQERHIDFLLNVFTLFFFEMVFRSTHKYMTVTNTKKTIRAPFSKFRMDAEQVDWKYNDMYNSVFSSDGRSEVHASIVSINGCGYYLSLYGLIKLSFWLKTKGRRKKAELIPIVNL